MGGLFLAAIGLTAPALGALDWTLPSPAATPETSGIPDQATLASTIERVTVYPQSALVTRTAQAPGPGEFVLEGLPHHLNASSVRVRVQGMQVMRVDVRDRFVRAVPDERLGALQAELDTLQRAIDALEVDLDAAKEQVEFFRGLLSKSLEGQAGEAAPDVDVWRSGGRFLGQGFSGALSELRRIEAELEDLHEEERALQAEISRGTGGSGHSVKDVFVALDGPAGRGAALEVDYLINGAQWTPAYDLRADHALGKVALSYRADVVQTTGEDWREVELFLSTANPNVGAQAPKLGAIMLHLARIEALRSLGYTADSAQPEFEMEELGYVEARKSMPASLMAAVLQNAGSLRYRVARRETIPSRSDTSRVLVGAADLSVTAEHRVVPARDLSVWLRGRATNDSQWELLPGMASVYFGGDFLGRTQLGHVRVGEEFTLDLGLDPNITVERVELESKAGSSGFFGSKSTFTQSWRLRLKATGAAARRPDGRVKVLVQEVLPKSQHEDLKVELDHAVPPMSKAERFAQDRADKGILTWEVFVPHMGETTIEWGYKLTFPDDMELIR